MIAAAHRRPAQPWLPPEMAVAPVLDPEAIPGPMRRRYALLINPFYRKDPNASFGKHVLTPTLALTATAGATPSHWEVRYWDENLLQGPPPLTPFPAVVGITVHLTFAQRAYELARWYRQWGAKVVLGGLHVLTAPDEAAEHADALAIGEGVQLWPRILEDVEARSLEPVYRGDYRKPYRDDPMPRRDLLPRDGFLTTSSLIATRGCHNRCGFCYLSTKGLHMPYRLRDVEQVAAEVRADGQPYAVFIDNNLGSRPDYLRALCQALKPLDIIWSAALTIDVTDDPALVRDMALAGCTGVFIGFESLNLGNLEDARKRTPEPDDYARRVKLLHDHGIQVNGSFVLGFDHDGPEVFEKTVEWIEDNRLECATFHVLTPYPETPLFRQFEREQRIVASRLASVRHGARRLRAGAFERRGAAGRLRVVLPAPVLTPLHLAPPAPRLARRAAVPRDVVSVQAIEPDLALVDPASVDGADLAAPDRAEPAAPPEIPASPRGAHACGGIPNRRQRGRVG